jgi:hypothetical protein
MQMKRKILMDKENETKSRLSQVKRTKTNRVSIDTALNENEFEGLTTDYNGYPIAIN